MFKFFKNLIIKKKIKDNNSKLKFIEEWNRDYRSALNMLNSELFISIHGLEEAQAYIKEFNLRADKLNVLEMELVIKDARLKEDLNNGR
jgi:hypothetical protein